MLYFEEQIIREYQLYCVVFVFKMNLLVIIHDADDTHNTVQYEVVVEGNQQSARRLLAT